MRIFPKRKFSQPCGKDVYSPLTIAGNLRICRSRRIRQMKGFALTVRMGGWSIDYRGTNVVSLSCIAPLSLRSLGSIDFKAPNRTKQLQLLQALFLA